MAEESRRNQRNSADASATTIQIPDSPDISLNDVSFTSMTVHMETVYAADKNVTVSTFPEPHDGAMDSSDASNTTSLVWTKLQHILSGWARITGSSENSHKT
jgi:hypothetical protein